MAQTNLDIQWKKTFIAEGAVTAWSIVIDGTAANQVKLPTSATTAPVGITLDDAADGEPVSVCIVGDVYCIDHVGTLNRSDRIYGSTTSSYHHTVVVATQGTHASFGTVVGDDASAADDQVLCRIDCAKPADIA